MVVASDGIKRLLLTDKRMTFAPNDPYPF